MEGTDWSDHQELLEIRLELTELITKEILYDDQFWGHLKVTTPN
jgi:hypothetical protein